jgi:outer membrane protein OmpA-like peptidoglycan-associated protein
MSFQLFAQTDTPFEKEYFPNDKDGFKEAKDAMKTADKIFDEGNLSYFNLCIPYYEKAYSFNPNSAELNYKLGVCYLNSPIKSRCLEYFEKSAKLNPAFDTFNINYLLARGHHLNENWDQAIDFYARQLKAMREQSATPEEFRTIEKHLEEATNGKTLSQEKVRVWIDNLGPAINSTAPEYAPLISTDESLLILTARRENSTGGLRDETDNLPYEDLYFSKNVGGDWTPLKNMGEEVNTSGHDASSGLSPDGRSLFVFRGTVKGGGDVYISRNEQGEWTKPKSLNRNVNSSAHESAIALSYDGSELYFVSEREGGFGGKDLYVSTYDYEKGEWGPARNLGTTINSKYDEDGVFIHPDGKTLYFSSEGHNSMGGNDIFYSERVNGEWTKPINIGYPINTPDDDVFFVVAADGRTAYYSSIRDEGYGEKDIYRITFLGPEKEPVLNVEEQLLAGSSEMSVEVPVQKEVKIKTSRMILLKGQVLDEETNAPVVASIDLIDNTTSQVLASFTSEEVNGSYLVSLPVGKNYGLNFNADGYLFNSLNFNLPDSAVFEEIYKVIKLKKIKIGKSIVLRNIFFDYNQYTIRSESQSELDRLVTLLNENPEIKVEISGHTDNVGGDAYNLELSDNRAKAVVEHLVSQGIAKERLIYKGYGESQPIASNDIPEGRQENRRTEFKIIE